MAILKESAAKNFVPLFRGTVPLMGHSLASATLGLVGQPKLQAYVKKELGQTGAVSSVASPTTPASWQSTELCLRNAVSGRACLAVLDRGQCGCVRGG